MEGSRSDGLGKLLPKAIQEKRRRRKQQRDPASSLRTTTSSLGDSDGTGSVSNVADEDDDDGRSFDDRSFGSFESGPDPEPTGSAAMSASKSSHSSKSASRNPSRSPSRPATVSQHPSLIGYLTTSSPAVQATHLDPQTQFRAQSPSSAESGRSKSRDRSRSRERSKPPSASATEAPVDLSSIISPPTAAKVASPSGRSRVTRGPDNISSPPATPSKGSDATAPTIINTPPSPNQTQFIEGRPAKAVNTWQPLSFRASVDVPTSSRTLNTHRRSSSASATLVPSKLSNVTSNPLTPPVEANEAANEGGNTGFFSSMISAAQSAATNLSSNIQNSGIALGGNRARATPTKSPAPSTPLTPSQQTEEVPSAPASQASDTMDQKDSAVRTLGAGDLSLSALGLDEPAKPTPSPPRSRLPDSDNTRARSESAPADTPVINNGEFVPQEPTSRPRSLVEVPDGDSTPGPSQLELDEKLGYLDRTGSLRRAHRKRGSSVTTANTVSVGAPLAGVTSPLPPPTANFSTPKLTGFAIASKKRNRDFHTIFKSVPDDDYLIEDYSCALQREILAHGRLYVSEGHLCFSSNILGWTTTLVMSFDEIVSVEKRSTALVFKNGLMVSTLHAKHVFASFTSRDATYDLIVNIWKLGHPTLKSTLNGVQLEGTGGDKTEKLDAEPSPADSDTQAETDSEEDSDDEDAEEFYDEEDIDEAAGEEAADSSGDKEPEKAVSRKVSALTTNGVPPAQNKDVPPAAGGGDFPGPATHAPTECLDASSHYDKVVGDEVIAAPLGKVYDLMFGQHSAGFMTKFLSGDQKCTDVQIDDKRGLSLDNKGRVYSYIKPLYNPLGPKSTKCIITEALDNLDFEHSASLTISTQTPDVPSGNVFVVKTKYCLSWAENNQTRVFVNCTIEWSGKSWIKGTIEKAAGEGQVEHCKSIFALLRSTISSRARAGTGPNGAPRKRKGKKGKGAISPLEAVERQAPKKAVEQDWGPLEPVRQLVEPFTDLVKPLLTGNVMYGLLVGLLVASWFGFGWSPSRDAVSYGPHTGMYTPDRLAAYEEMWRREDSELWEWLEERIGLGRLDAEGGNARKKAMQPRTAEEKLREEHLDVKELEEAMRVTEEKLRIMQDAIGRSSHAPQAPAYNNADGV